MTDRERELYETKYKPAYAAFMKAYPLSLDNLVGERWAWIRNYEGLYQESTLGRTKRFYKTKPAKIIAPHINVQGYLRMTLWKNGKCKKFTVSRLVAETFIPNANGFLQVDHIDGVKFNNSIENLRWATPSENMQFAVSSGLIKSGEDNYLALLTNEQVKHVRENSTKLSTRKLADEFGVTQSVIIKAQLGKTYKKAGGELRQAKHKSPRVPVAVRRQIRAEYVKGSNKFGVIALAKKYALGKTTIWRIVNEK